MLLNLDDQFSRQLPADPIDAKTRRQVEGAAFSFVTPRVPSDPKVLHVTSEVADLIGISADEVEGLSLIHI